MSYSSRSRLLRIAVIGLLACGATSLHPGPAAADGNPPPPEPTLGEGAGELIGFFSTVAQVIQTAKKIYDGLHWIDCQQTAISCEDSEAHQEASRVLATLGAATLSIDVGHMTARVSALLDRADRDFRHPANLMYAEEVALVDEAEAVFYDFATALDATDPTSALLVERSYRLAPAFTLLVATVDTIARTAIARNQVPIDMAWLTDKRGRAVRTLYGLVGSRAVWPMCSGGNLTMTSTTESYEQAFVPKKLWKWFADFSFSYDDCGNDCNVFRHFTSPASDICKRHCSAGICFGACVIPDSEWVYESELPQIIKKMDNDLVVQAIRSAMGTLVSLRAPNQVSDSVCGGGGSLTSGLTIVDLAVGANADGRLEVFYEKDDGHLYHQAQSEPNGDWTGEAALGATGNQISVAQNTDGRLEIFYPMSNVMFHESQAEPNGAWTGEAGLMARARKVAAAKDSTGRLQVFYTGPFDNIGAISYIRQSEPGGGWESPNFPALLYGEAGELAVGTNADKRLELFFTRGGGDVYHMRQNTPGGNGWGGAELLGNGASRIAVAAGPDNQLELIYLGEDGAIMHRRQQAQNATAWSIVQPMGGQAREITVGQHADGRLETFYIGLDGGIFHNTQQLRPFGAWGGEQFLGGSHAKKLAVGRNQDGRLELFYVQEAVTGSLGGVLMHMVEMMPGVWSDETAMPVFAAPPPSVEVPPGQARSVAEYTRGDFDGDGGADLIITTDQGSFWYYSNGNGVWDSSSYARPDLPRGAVKFTPGDFNGDGKTDLVITTPQGSYWYYSLGRGSWDSWSYSRPDLPLNAVSYTPGDFNGDHKTDLIITTSLGSFWYYSLGQGVWDGTSYVRADLPLGTVAYTPGDFDGDGRSDVVITTRLGSFWYYSLAGGGFDSSSYIRGDLPLGTVAYTPGDFDGDGRSDLVITTALGSFWYDSLGRGSWDSNSYIRGDLPLGTVAFTPGDFDGDGKSDLIITTALGSFWYYSLGRTWQNDAYVRPDLPLGTVRYVQGDFGGDHRADLVITTGLGSFWYQSLGTGQWKANIYVRPDLTL
jgi:hypothetical protein